MNREVAEAATALAREAPLYWELRVPQPVDLAALHSGSGSRRGLLRKDEALVYLVVPSGSRHGLVFAVSRHSQAWARIGMSGDEIKDAVGRLRRDIDPDAYGVENAPEPDQAEFNRSLAFRLHQALLEDPAIRGVIAPKHTLIFVPTGPLTALPPGLLITKPPAGNDGDAVVMQSTAWLLREHAIAVLPSVAALRLIREFDRQRYGRPSEPLLAFTNPDFAGTGTSPDTVPEREKRLARNFRSYFIDGALRLESLKAMPPLPDALEEGVALAKILKAPVSSVLTRPSASKAELFKRNADGTLARTRILEFATHGLVAGAGDGAAEPALVLAAGKTADDWILTASEASTLRINADWVLLSACNTASPDDDGADGLSGLVRGFFYAGAPALLVSHWTVDDTAVQLVPNAITLRMKGLSRAEALRRASLAILDQPDHRKTNPYYWATFALVGDPD